MTGLNPGKHGIFQWRTYDPTKYTCLDERLMTSSRLAGRTFWDILGSSGYRVGVVTVPMTYPAWAVNGFLLAGYPCPDTKRNYTYPPEWADDLTEPYNFSVDDYVQMPEEAIWKEGLSMLERRTSLAIRLIAEQQVQVCVVVLGEIDRAQHDFWKYTDPRFPAYDTARGQQYHEVIHEHYQVADVQIGRMLQHAGEDTMVVIMSDHGGGPHPARLFQTNAWLRDQGWLVPVARGSVDLSAALRSAVGVVRRHLPFEERLRRLLPARIVDRVRRVSMNIADVKWTETQAYRFPMYHPVEGVEINLRGRQPQGIVSPGEEYDALREQIIAALRQARNPADGTLIVRHVYRREELYQGPYLPIAPDIVFVTAPDFKADSGLRGAFATAAPLADLDKYSGLHTMDGIFIARGNLIRGACTVSDMELADLAPTLLYALDEPIPEDMDGRVRADLFAPSVVASRRIRHREPAMASAEVPEGLTPEEEEQMRAKLRALGYVE
jgi:predicted AlkP superfamily phosphohydrolase/phosphomutase